MEACKSATKLKGKTPVISFLPHHYIFSVKHFTIILLEIPSTLSKLQT